MKRLVICILFFSWFPSLLLWGIPNKNYPLSEAKILRRSLAYVEHNYLDPDRIDTRKLFEGSLDEIQKLVPEILVQCEDNTFCGITIGNASRRFRYPKPTDISELTTLLQEVLSYIDKNVSPDTDKMEIEYAAISGLLNKLDPHSNFLTPEIYKEFQISTRGEFGGLGIVIGIRDGRLTVISPIQGTPAFKAGVKAKDTITQIDDDSTINMSLPEAVSLLRGRVGSKVTIKIERPGKNEPFDVHLVREIISVESVQSKLLRSPNGKKVGMIRLKSFQDNTKKDFEKQLLTLTKEGEGLDGLILDLRHNPGGLLNQAIYIADEFLNEGTIVTTVGSKNKIMDLSKASKYGLAETLPLIVLLN